MREMREKVDYESTDKDLGSSDLNAVDIADMMRYSMEEQNGCVLIRPMDGTDVITIHGEEEATLFTDCLMDYFQKG